MVTTKDACWTCRGERTPRGVPMVRMPCCSATLCWGCLQDLHQPLLGTGDGRCPECSALVTVDPIGGKVFLRGDGFRERPPTVETEIWESNPDKPGYQRLARRRTVGEVHRDIMDIVGRYPPGGEEYFSVSCHHMVDRLQKKHRKEMGIQHEMRCKECQRIYNEKYDLEFPEGRIHISVVTGGSEGHYVHVDVHQEGKIYDVFLGKTFMGYDAAWDFAKRIGRILWV